MHVALVVLVTAAAAALVAVPVALLARARGGRGGASAVEAELVARLTEEVRGWRAEAEHWQRTALRLQAELDAGEANRPGERAAGDAGVV